MCIGLLSDHNTYHCEDHDDDTKTEDRTQRQFLRHGKADTQSEIKRESDDWHEDDQ